MAEFEYGGGGDDLGSTKPFESDYMGYDPRLPSQRFDSSQRFDESFRAPDHFAPTFGDDVKEDGEDEYKSANGFGYHHSDAPPSYGYEDDLAGHPADAPSAYVPTFEPDPSNEFGGEVDYTSAPPLSGNGFGAHDESLFSGAPAGNGPILPDPEDMKEEGSKLREWKSENAIRLQEKERKEREKLAQVIADADYYKDEVYVKRKNTMENGRKTNRDKEKVFLTNQENFHKNADKQYWKAVAELIPNELPTIDTKGPTTKKDKKERKPSIVAIKGPKPGKPTDVTRMRQILVKLKHTPPPHMKPPPPPPAPEKEKDAKTKDGKDAKDAKDKDAKDKDGKEKTPTPADKDGKERTATEAPVEGDAVAAPGPAPAEPEAPAPAPVAAAVTA